MRKRSAREWLTRQDSILGRLSRFFEIEQEIFQQRELVSRACAGKIYSERKRLYDWRKNVAILL